MSRALARRLARLEEQARAHNAPTWPEVHAAAERFRSHAVATLKALLHGQDPPGRDEPQARADAAMIDRWGAGPGVRVDWAGAGARVRAKLTATTRPRSAPPPKPLHAIRLIAFARLWQGDLVPLSMSCLTRPALSWTVHRPIGGNHSIALRLLHSSPSPHQVLS